MTHSNLIENIVLICHNLNPLVASHHEFRLSDMMEDEDHRYGNIYFGDIKFSFKYKNTSILDACPKLLQIVSNNKEYGYCLTYNELMTRFTFKALTANVCNMEINSALAFNGSLIVHHTALHIIHLSHTSLRWFDEESGSVDRTDMFLSKRQRIAVASHPIYLVGLMLAQHMQYEGGTIQWDDVVVCHQYFESLIVLKQGEKISCIPIRQLSVDKDMNVKSNLYKVKQYTVSHDDNLFTVVSPLGAFMTLHQKDAQTFFDDTTNYHFELLPKLTLTHG